LTTSVQEIGEKNNGKRGLTCTFRKGFTEKKELGSGLSVHKNKEKTLGSRQTFLTGVGELEGEVDAGCRTVFASLHLNPVRRVFSSRRNNKLKPCTPGGAKKGEGCIETAQEENFPRAKTGLAKLGEKTSNNDYLLKRRKTVRGGNSGGT